jgi:hypothetical protein
LYLRFSLSYRDVEELLQRGMSADHVTVWRWVQRYAPELDRRLRSHLKPTNKSWRVDETYIRVKGPLLGRTFTAADDKRGCPAIAVLSHDFWQREYGGAADVFERRLTLSSHPVRIVGVAPPGFNGIQVGEAVEIYLTLRAEGTLVRENSALDKRANWWLWVFARLKPGIGEQQALARMNMLAPQPGWRKMERLHAAVPVRLMRKDFGLNLKAAHLGLSMPATVDSGSFCCG